MSFFILHICRLNPTYVPPSRHTVAEVADERHYEITCTEPKRPKTGVSELFISSLLMGLQCLVVLKPTKNWMHQ